MASYLLLRDNKESGPYNLDELVRFGLKPYDLIWVESRSAAWRYPSEIPELKAYAPIVEEQPYDRFFKKQQAETVEQLLEQRLSIEKDKIEKEKKNIQQEPAPIIESQKPAYQSPAAKVFNHGSQAEEEKQPVKPKMKEKKEEENPYEAYQPRPNVFVSKPSVASSNNPRSEKQVEKQAAAYSAYSAASQEPVLERKYSQSLDEIKEMYVNTLVQRKSKNRRRELMKKYLKPALVSVSLVVAGIIIGYFLLNRDATIQAAQGISTVIPSQSQDSSQQKNQILQPDENQPGTTETDKKDSKLLDQQLLAKQKLEARNQPQQQTTDGSLIVTDPAMQTPTDEQQKIEKQDVEVDPQTNERNRVVRADEDPSIDQPKENKTSISDNDTKDLKKFVSVNANEYLRGVFGGIRDLKITVSNRSKYVLDAVTVKIQYMKISNQPLKTETITFKNVSPNDAETIKLPDSQRGTRVTYHITNIESKQFQKNTAGL